MLGAWLVTISVGLIWSAIGVVMASVKKRKFPEFAFYLFGTATAAIIGWVILFAKGALDLNAMKDLPLLCTLSGAALLNSIGQVLTLKNLEGKGSSLAYALPQTCFLIPFLFTIMFQHETLNIWKMCGLASITVAIYAMAIAAGKGNGLSIKKLLIGGLSALLIGSSQILLMQAMQSAKQYSVSSLYCSVIVMSVSIFVFGTIVYIRRRIARFERGIIKWSVLWGVLAILSFSLLFHALNRMSIYGSTGIVFAVGSSMCIVGFSLFSWFKLNEKFSRITVSAIALIIIGIISIRLG